MKLHNLTICDQVRQEVTGKFFLIGVYSNGILVQQFPAQFGMSIWGLLEAHELGTNTFGIRARMSGSEEALLMMEGDVEIQELENWTPIGFGGPINLPSEGKLLIEAKFNAEDWKTLRTLNCTKAQAINHPNLP